MNHFSRIGLFVGFTLGLCQLSWAQETFPQKAEVDALVQPYLDNGEMQSLSIAVVSKGKTWTLHYGTLDGASEVVPSDRTVYEIGSISKVFTSLLLSRAVVDGQVTLDQTLDSLLPSLLEKNPKVGAGITLQHLSQHTSGLPRLPFNLIPKDPDDPYADYGRVELLKFMESVKTQRKAGEKHEYSNLAVGLLGDLLGQRAAGDYGSVLAKQVLGPLAMSDSGLSVEDAEGRSFALPHGSGLFPNHAWHFQALAGAGGIRSTARDMGKFVEAWLHPPEGQLGEAMELSWKESLAATDDHPAMGLGWMIAGDGETRWHNGMTGGYQSIMFVNRERDMGLVLLSNTSDSQGDVLGGQIMRLLNDEEVAPTEFEAGLELDPEDLQRLVGRYQLNRSTVIEVEVRGQNMQVRLSGQMAQRVYPEDLMIWKYRVVKAKLIFNLDKPGPSMQVTFQQNWRWTKAPRIR